MDGLSNQQCNFIDRRYNVTKIASYLGLKKDDRLSVRSAF